jgi:hypothetical protein
MTKFTTTAAATLANRVSRRSFLGRSGQMLLGVVGGSALYMLMAGNANAAATAQLTCSCSSPCLHWGSCTCSGSTRMRNHYMCDGCYPQARCEFTRCTNIPC